MNRTRRQQSYETRRDKMQKISNQKRNYSDYRVLIGFWFDERAAAEAQKEILHHNTSKSQQLSFQNSDGYMYSVTRPMQLTRNLDGFLHHSDLVRLRWIDPTSSNVFFLAALPSSIAADGSFEEPCLATATTDNRVMSRCAFHVFRNNNKMPNHIPLMYGECIIICTADRTGHRLLNSEPKTFSVFAQMSGHQEVTWVKELSGRSLWKILQEKKNDSKKMGEKFIPSNTNVIIRHVPTGQNLSFEKDTVMNTVMGKEKEVSCHCYMDRNRREGKENMWQFEAPLMKPEDYGKLIRLPKERPVCGICVQ